MFVSGPWPVRVGKAGQEAGGGEVGGGGGGVGLRGEAARRSGAASEVAVWACGVAAAARAAARAPGLRLFVFGALGGVAGGLEGWESGVKYSSLVITPRFYQRFLDSKAVKTDNIACIKMFKLCAWNFSLEARRQCTQLRAGSRQVAGQRRRPRAYGGTLTRRRRRRRRRTCLLA